MVNIEECDYVGVGPIEVDILSSKLSKLAKEAKKLGLPIFGGSSPGTLRFIKDNRTIVIAHLKGDNYDGGDRAIFTGADGLQEGESQ